MSWTKEIPTVDGYYWVRLTNGDTWIDEIRDSKAMYWSFIEDSYEEVFDYAKSNEYSFYGPLEEPK